MAKKKAKKKQNKLSKYLLFGAIVSAVLVLVGLFLSNIDVLNLKDEVSSSFTGLQLAFGAELANLDLGVIVKSSGKLTFNILITLAFVLPIIATVLALLLGKSKMLSVVLGLVCTAVFVFSLIIIIKSGSIATVKVTTDSILGSNESTTKLVEYIGVDYMKMGIGAIISLIGAGLGAVCSLGSVVPKAL
jgi:hypothetical protein